MTLWGTDLTLQYPIPVGPATVTLATYVFNIFNEQIAVDRDNSWSTSPPANFAETVFDPNQQQTNPTTAASRAARTRGSSAQP
jgi:hypothetical protein